MSRRIVVMGCAGAGKSVLARRLAAHWRLTYIARDDLAGPGQNTPEFRAAVERATAAEGWVFDGTPFAVEDLVIPRADLVVFLDYSRARVTTRAIRRALRVLVTGRPDGPHQRENPLHWLQPAHPVRWSWSSQPRRRQQLCELMAAAPAEKQHFRRPLETRRWLRASGGRIRQSARRLRPGG
ncbi:MAG TPA: hypothetical protein VHC49_04780 [Mycobacteriales bacterium]|nr:hypothetical protein [Mycobacteriales bacterium]